MRIKSKIALAAVAWAAASAALGATANFAYTGAAQTWTVPAGVTQVTLDLRGAQGGGVLRFRAPGRARKTAVWVARPRAA
ncbi:MAG: hypothetical protein V9G22_04970 [Ottowia sp.]